MATCNDCFFSKEYNLSSIQPREEERTTGFLWWKKTHKVTVDSLVNMRIRDTYENKVRCCRWPKSEPKNRGAWCGEYKPRDDV